MPTEPYNLGYLIKKELDRQEREEKENSMDYYQQVIDVLFSGNYSDPDMVRILARDYPEVFLEIYDKTLAVDNLDAENDKNRERQVLINKASSNSYILGLILDGKKIDAIKELRMLAGAGLKDAKETIESAEVQRAAANYRDKR